MIRITLEMPDKSYGNVIVEMSEMAYEKAKSGIRCGPFGCWSLQDMMKMFDIKILTVQHIGDTKND
jgi:hypothetical protein